MRPIRITPLITDVMNETPQTIMHRSFTMRSLQNILLAAVAGCALLTSACISGNNTDSQTHWLDSCSSSAECENGLECLCGVCSQECGDTMACGSTPGASVCVTREQGPSEQLCAVQIDVRGICLPQCVADEDCSDDQACRFNKCVPREELGRVDTPENNQNNSMPDMGGPFFDMSEPVDFGLPPGDMNLLPDDMEIVVDMQRDMPPSDMGFFDIGIECEPVPICPPNGHSAEIPMSGQNGCPEYTCVEEASRPCGEWMCETGSSYCQVLYPGVPPENNMDNGPNIHCGMLSPECSNPITCECILQGHSPETECILREDGLFEITEYLP